MDSQTSITLSHLFILPASYDLTNEDDGTSTLSLAFYYCLGTVVKSTSYQEGQSVILLFRNAQEKKVNSLCYKDEDH